MVGSILNVSHVIPGGKKFSYYQCWSKSRIIFKAAFYLPVCLVRIPELGCPSVGSSSSRFSLLIREEEFAPQRFFNSPTGPTELECAGRERVTRDCNTVLLRRDELNPYLATMAVAGCTRCIKYMLFFFNFIFWVSFSDVAFAFETLDPTLKYWRVF